MTRAICVLALLLSTGCATPRAAFPVFASGPAFNVPPFVPGSLADNDRAITNASAHVAWSLAVPALGHLVAGRRGMWTAAVLWVGWTLAAEAFLHAPPGPLGPEYSAEVRTDLVTRIVPALVVLVAYELARGGR